MNRMYPNRMNHLHPGRMNRLPPGRKIKKQNNDTPPALGQGVFLKIVYDCPV